MQRNRSPDSFFISWNKGPGSCFVTDNACLKITAGIYLCIVYVFTISCGFEGPLSLNIEKPGDKTENVSCLLKRGLLFRQKLNDPLPPPEFISLPHPASRLFDTHPAGNLLYGVLGKEGLELWMVSSNNSSSSKPVKLYDSVVNARFSGQNSIVFLDHRGNLYLMENHQADRNEYRLISSEISSFEAGDKRLYITRTADSDRGRGLWIIDSDYNEKLLTTSSLEGLWSARYSPAESPSGKWVAFYAGNPEDGFFVHGFNIETGIEKVLNREPLPPPDTIMFAGEDNLILSGPGFYRDKNSALMLLNIRNTPQPFIPIGSGLPVGLIDNKVLVHADDYTDSFYVRRKLFNPNEPALIIPASITPVQAVYKNTEASGIEGDPLDTMRQMLGFYDIKHSRPLQEGRISSFFSHSGSQGLRFDCACNGTTRCRTGHNGTDFAAPRGTGLYASANGTVDHIVTGCVEGSTSCGGGYGNYVRLLHGNGHLSYYAHMQRIDVSGSTGSILCHRDIGTVGNTGNSTGPHVHYEIRSSSGTRLDPFDGQCNNTVNQTLWISQGNINPSFTCQCMPQCSGRECGDDGCGGSCGTCSHGECDNTSGRCITDDDATLISSEPSSKQDIFVEEVFTMQWTVQNTGTTTWRKSSGYRLVFDGGERFGASEIFDLGDGETITPGQTKVWNFEGVAPGTIGTWRAYFRMDRNGQRFGERLVVEIEAGADFDGDGHHADWAGGDDCDPYDPEVYPGAPEQCNGKDNNCNGIIDDGLSRECSYGCGTGIEYCENGEWVGCTAPTTGPGCDENGNHTDPDPDPDPDPGEDPDPDRPDPDITDPDNQNPQRAHRDVNISGYGCSLVPYGSNNDNEFFSACLVMILFLFLVPGIKRFSLPALKNCTLEEDGKRAETRRLIIDVRIGCKQKSSADDGGHSGISHAFHGFLRQCGSASAGSRIRH